MPRTALVLLIAGAVVGCSSSSDPSPSGSSGTTSGGTTSGGTTSGGTTSGGTTSGGTTSGGMTSGGAPVDGVPTNAADMNAFLQKKDYASWAKESAPHASTGPHGSLVLTYLNPKLDGSLKSGGAEHPAGSAAVKEFYSNGKVSGWAAYVKTQATSDGGKNWYWYEVFDATPGASASQGLGNPVCTGCHSQGTDYVRIPYPLN